MNNIFLKQLNEDANKLKQMYAELEATEKQILDQKLMVKAKFDYIVELSTRVQQTLAAAPQPVPETEKAPELKEQLEQAFAESSNKEKVVDRQLQVAKDSDQQSVLKEEVKTVAAVKEEKPKKETKVRTVKPAPEPKQPEPTESKAPEQAPPVASADDDWGDDEWSESATSAAATSPTTNQASNSPTTDDDDDWGA